MDGFSLVVLERTLELVIDAMPPERNPAVAESVSVIRQYIESPHRQDAASVHRVMTNLTQIAHDNRQFLIATRLQAFTREICGNNQNHDVA